MPLMLLPMGHKGVKISFKVDFSPSYDLYGGQIVAILVRMEERRERKSVALEWNGPE